MLTLLVSIAHSVIVPGFFSLSLTPQLLQRRHGNFHRLLFYNFFWIKEKKRGKGDYLLDGVVNGASGSVQINTGELVAILLVPVLLVLVVVAMVVLLALDVIVGGLVGDADNGGTELVLTTDVAGDTDSGHDGVLGGQEHLVDTIVVLVGVLALLVLVVGVAGERVDDTLLEGGLVVVLDDLGDLDGFDFGRVGHCFLIGCGGEG